VRIAAEEGPDADLKVGQGRELRRQHRQSVVRHHKPREAGQARDGRRQRLQPIVARVQHQRRPANLLDAGRQLLVIRTAALYTLKQ